MFVFYSNMKIPNQLNSMSFGSTPIHRVNVYSAVDNKLIPAVFSRLNQNNLQDIKALTQIKDSWKNVYFSLTSDLCDSFLKKEPYEYYAIELTNNEPLDKKIIGLAQLDIDRIPKLKILTTHPDFTIEKNPKRTIKGVGEVLFGETVNTVKKNGLGFLEFCSLNDAFYDKILKNAKIDPQNVHGKYSRNYVLVEKYFNGFLEYISNKYKINFSKETKKL